MSRHATARGHREVWSIGLIVAVTSIALLLSTGGTQALFTDKSMVTTGTFGAGAIDPPARPSLTQTVGTGEGAVSWASVAVGLGTATGYEVVRYASATGGTGTVVCSSPTASLSCVEPKPDSAASNTTYYYALRARFAANWVRESTTRTAYTPDVIVPTGTFNSPYNTTTACAATEAVCGSAADTGGGSVARIEYTLMRTTRSLGAVTATDCWNGTAYSSAPNGACTTFFRGTGTTTWAVPGRRTTVYANPPIVSGVLSTYSWTLVIKLADTFENVRTSSPIASG